MKPLPGVKRRPLLQVFGIPILLGVLSGVGHLSALLGDDLWDGLSWLALGVPCAAIAWYWFGEARFGGNRDENRRKSPSDCARFFRREESPEHASSRPRKTCSRPEDDMLTGEDDMLAAEDEHFYEHDKGRL